jgi:hypothetical protein
MQPAMKLYYTNQNLRPATQLVPDYESTSALGTKWSNVTTLTASKSNKSLSRQRMEKEKYQQSGIFFE